MPHAEHRVTINRPAPDVFAYLADGEKCPQWREGVLEITRTSGDGLGAEYKQSVRGPGGRGIRADYTITEYVPNTALAFQTTSGPVRPEGRYTLSESGGATTVTFVLDAQLTGIKKLLMSGAVTKTMKNEVQALDKVKTILET